MANFPTSVYGPASKSAGQTIQPAHVNDLDGEVAAIEAGYLNGTARLNSSNSTVANLSVAGGSTFTGKLIVASTSAIACRLTSTVSVNVPDQTWVALNWETERFDQDGMHSTAANSSRVTFVTAGVYLIGANIAWSDGSTAGVRQMEVLVNDVTEIALIRDDAGEVGGRSPIQVLNTVYQMAANDYATLRIWQDSGSTASNAVTSAYTPELWAARVG